MNKIILKLTIIVFSILLSVMFNSVLGHAGVSFLAMGDSPYTNEGFYIIEKELKNIPNNVKFLIHLGDIKRSDTKCKEKVYKDFRDLFVGLQTNVYRI